MDDLLPEFLAETNEALAELDLALVRLERDPTDASTLSLIFRLVHTIKGTCGFLGLPRLERVAHSAENVLGRLREGELVAGPAVVTLVLAALDRIKEIVAGLAATGTEPAGDDSPVIEALDHASNGTVPPANPAANPPANPLADAPARGAAEAVRAERPAKRARRAKPSAPTLPAATAAPAPPAKVPPLEPPNDHPPAPAASALPPAPEGATGTAPDPATQTIRVNVDVLEELMTLVGELVLTRNQLMQLSRAETAAKGAASAYTLPLQRLSHITSDLQDGVMKTRMQPIGSAWNKLPRLVRDLAQETGKQIVLEMRGQDTELDRQVLELMRDPLTHMVRNSADHGLETPAIRRAAGKPESGRILLNAYHEGGHIIIEISDDGRGIDVARVRAKALANGLATEAELAGMTEAQIRSFIFRAGFSTAEAITAISGRGVGMDVVRSNIERIGGTIELSSTQGLGSCFTVKIPLTLAIVSAVIVEAGGERFAVPQIAVRELVRVSETAETPPQTPANADAPATGPDTEPARGRAEPDGQSGAPITIERVGGAPVLRLRDELLPLVHLSSLLRLDAAGADTSRAEGATVVVVAIGSVKLGILVDEVFDTEEIVVKPVAPVLRHVTMFSGNTILGDGSVIMILDPNGVARSAGIAARAAKGDAQDTPDAAIAAEDHVALLLFRAGGGSGMFAVPLNLVARLETIPRDRIETSCGGSVTQYRGQLMKLIGMGGEGGPDGLPPSQPVLVFADGTRCMGLMVDSIIDVVHGQLKIELGSSRPGVLGAAIIGGQSADVLDTGYWLTLAAQDWFAAPTKPTGRRPRILVVEDSDFFRQLLIPALSAAGFDTAATGSAREALSMRGRGLQVDAIVSDIEMPSMDGLEFARAVRADGPWAAVPMIALSAHDSAADNARALEAGFSAYVQKSQRAELIGWLQACVADAGSLATSEPALA